MTSLKIGHTSILDYDALLDLKGWRELTTTVVARRKAKEPAIAGPFESASVVARFDSLRLSRAQRP